MELSRREVLSHTVVGAGIVRGSSRTQPGSDWSNPFADPQNTSHAGLPSPTSGIGVEWRTSFDTRISARPTTADGKAYLGLEDGQIFEISLETGEHRSMTTLPARPGWYVTAGPERLYLTALNETLYAIDRQSGDVEWRREMSTRQGSIIVRHDGDLFIGRHDGTLYRFDATDGTKLWEAALPNRIEMPPAVTGTTVVARDYGGTTVAVDREDGSQKWELATGAGSLVPAADCPVVKDDLVFVERTDPTGDDELLRQVIALDIESGDQRWHGSRLQGTLISLVSRPDRIVHSSHRELRSVDPATGQHHWSRPLENPGTIGEPVTHLASVDGAIYAVGDDVRVIDPATGDVRYRLRPSTEADADGLGLGPAIPNGILVRTNSELIAVSDSGSTGSDDVPWTLVGGAGAAVLGGGALLWRQLQKRSTESGASSSSGGN